MASRHAPAIAAPMHWRVMPLSSTGPTMDAAMRAGWRRAAFVVLLAVVASACSGQGAQTERPVATFTDRGPMDQPWANALLIDVRTNERFRIVDLVAAGRVVFLEPMAVWCSKCRAQQERAVEAIARLDPELVTWIGLDVETAESAEQLARYSTDAGFDFTYVIADREVSRALADEFGDVVLNPPATNVIVIEPSGEVTHATGGHSADELVEIATAALS